jgi:hypothetical protein
MIVWPAKDPAEVLDYTWQPPLDTGDTIASHTATVGSGAIVKDSSSHSDTSVTMWASGGTDGENSTVTLSVVTTAGRAFREVAVLPVFDRASNMLALFRLRYPGFAAVTDGAIGFWMADAAINVSDGWPADHRDTARLALAAHNLALSGQGKGAIPAGVTSFKSGTFSATVSDSAASRTGLSATPYGREYLALMRRYFGGPRLAWTPPAALYDA